MRRPRALARLLQSNSLQINPATDATIDARLNERIARRPFAPPAESNIMVAMGELRRSADAK
jgi:hypothetical protein